MAKYVLCFFILVVIVGGGLLWGRLAEHSRMPAKEPSATVETQSPEETEGQEYVQPDSAGWAVTDGREEVSSLNLNFEAVDALKEDKDSNSLPEKQEKKESSAQANEASKQKFIEGLEAFNQNNYTQARAAWLMAKQLDPSNEDADLGLRKVEELMGIR